MLRRRHNPPELSPALFKEPKAASAGDHRHRAVDQVALQPPTAPLSPEPPKLTPATPPSEEVWALQKQISELNDAIAAARAESDAQQLILAAARDERDKWRQTAEHIEAESHNRKRVLWGVGGLAAGAAVHFLTRKRP